MSPERASIMRKGKVIPCRGAEDKTSRRNQQWEVWYEESGGREYPMKSGEYGRVCKVEDVTEIRRSSVRNTFIAESIYLVLNSLRDREPVE